MVNDSFEQQIHYLWKKILPASVQVSCGRITENDKYLTELERASIGNVTPLRLQEFSAGRKHAHLALSALNAETKSIIKCGQSGKPIWPTGVIGSITHTASQKLSHVAAVVSRNNTLKHLGIDAEIDLHIHPNLWQQFITETELEDIFNLPVTQRSNRVNEIWCLKESSIKASGVRDVLNITTKSADLSNGSYEILVKTPENQLLMLGRSMTLNGITIAAVYEKSDTPLNLWI